MGVSTAKSLTLVVIMFGHLMDEFVIMLSVKS